MKIKLDENIPMAVSHGLSLLGHDVDTVIDEGLSGMPDDTIWLSAQKEERFLVTQDLDFSDTRKFKPGSHCGILLIRLRMPGKTAIAQRITAIFSAEHVESWKGCFVILSDSKLRILRAIPD